MLSTCQTGDQLFTTGSLKTIRSLRYRWDHPEDLSDWQRLAFLQRSVGEKTWRSVCSVTFLLFSLLRLSWQNQPAASILIETLSYFPHDLVSSPCGQIFLFAPRSKAPCRWEVHIHLSRDSCTLICLSRYDNTGGEERHGDRRSVIQVDTACKWQN